MDWDTFDKGIFLVNLLGIIYNPASKKVLIGRRSDDKYITNLSWVFPGGRPNYDEDLELNLVATIKEATGLDAQLSDISDIVFAKSYPEQRKFLSIYYLVEMDGDVSKVIPGGNLKEFKWVKPTDVTKYFTTSLHPVVLNYLKTLE